MRKLESRIGCQNLGKRIFFFNFLRIDLLIDIEFDAAIDFNLGCSLRRLITKIGTNIIDRGNEY